MQNQVISLLEENFILTSMDKEILNKNTRELNRYERRYYFQKLKPREREFKEYFKEMLHSSNKEKQNQLKNMVVTNLLARKGEPTIADGLFMDILGRLEVYRQLREQAEKEGVKLKALTNFGGMGMLIILVGVISAIILYFWAR